MAEATTAPPSKALMLMELRAMPELFGFSLSWPTLAALCPRGDGQPVLVLPGLITTDRSTIPLRSLLKTLGYQTSGWEMGRNYGPLPGVETGLKDKLKAMADEHGRKVSVVGWSLGGIYARQLAKMMPNEVRQVVTLGSPFKGDPKATNAWKVYQFTSGHKVDDRDRHMGGAISDPTPVPTTAVYSKTDGVCHWRTCVEEPSDIAENIEVRGSHCGLGHLPSAAYAVADRLAQKEGAWTHFDRTGFKSMIYPRPAA